MYGISPQGTYHLHFLINFCIWMFEEPINFASMWDKRSISDTCCSTSWGKVMCNLLLCYISFADILAMQ